MILTEVEGGHTERWVTQGHFWWREKGLHECGESIDMHYADHHKNAAILGSGDMKGM